MKDRFRKLSPQDWEHLLLLASGYLPLTNGDLRAAMSRAIEAHADLISAVKAGTLSAELPEGRVTMFVPQSGGIALRLHLATDLGSVPPSTPPSASGWSSSLPSAAPELASDLGAPTEPLAGADALDPPTTPLRPSR